MSSESLPPSPHAPPRPQNGASSGVSSSGWWTVLLPPDGEGETIGGVTARDRWVLTCLLLPMAIMLGLHGWRWAETERSTITVVRAAEVIPPTVEAPTVGSSPPQTTAYVFRINVNTATWIEWAQLDGIGEKLAKRIVAHRTEHGPFASVEDVGRVKGIGAKTLDKIRPHLTFAAAE